MTDHEKQLLYVTTNAVAGMLKLLDKQGVTGAEPVLADVKTQWNVVRSEWSAKGGDDMPAILAGRAISLDGVPK